MKRLWIVVLFGTMVMNAAMAESLYVQSLKGDVMAQPAFNAAKVGSVQRGDQLMLLKRQGVWCQVKFDGKQGWMPKLLLAEQPPMKKVSVFTGNENVLKHKARVRASNVTTAGAARGLSSDRRRVTAVKGANFSAVDQMEALQISEADALKFIEQGVRP